MRVNSQLILCASCLPFVARFISEDWGLESESGLALVHQAMDSVPALDSRSGSVPGLAQDSELRSDSGSATDSDSAS